MDSTKKELAEQTRALGRRLEKLKPGKPTHKGAEETWVDERNLLRTLIDNLPDAIYIKDTKGRFIIGNTEFARRKGVATPDELVGKTDFDFHPQELAAQYYADEQEIIRSGQPLINREEKVINQTTGETIWSLATKAPWRDSYGKIVGIMGIGRDITEQREVEKKLRKAEQDSSVILQSMSEHIVYRDTTMRVLWANKAAADSVGLAPEQLVGRYCYEIWHNRNKPCVVCPVREALESGQQKESEITTPDGRVWWIRAYPTRDANDDIAGIANLTLEITERKQAEEALRESEERYRAIFEQAADSIVLVNTETGELAEFNERAHDNLGYTREEFKKLKISDFEAIESAEEVTKHLEKIVKEGSDVFETKHRAKSGEIRDILASTKAISISRRGFALSIWRDITERKRAEKKLLDYQAQLKTLASELFLAEERERRRLAAGIHDHISQNLVLAKLTLQLLTDSTSDCEASASLCKVCATIEQTIQDLRTLIFELSNPVLYELGFEAAVKQWLTEQVQEKYGVKCKLTTNKHPLKLDNEISVILFQAVRELLVNVIKHAKANTVWVHIQKAGDRIRIAVEDDGVGFPPSKLDSSLLQSKTGGFGLFSIRERLDNLGGELKIKSVPGQGTCITMSAPLK